MSSVMNSRLSIFPVSTSIGADGGLSIAGHSLKQLAQEYGTPLYVYDAETVRCQVRHLRQSLADYYEGESRVAYAGKAYLSLGMAAHMEQLGAGLDVVSLGEMRIANLAGFQPGGVHLHGNNKSRAELQAALDWGIQAIVVDSLDELSFLEDLAEQNGKLAAIWLRITPDLEVKTHPHILTSNSASKFGLHIANGQAAEAIHRAKASPWLKLTGLHAHLGSQLFDAAPYQQTIEKIFTLSAEQNFIPQQFSPGGGWGVRYSPEDPDDDPTPWVKAVSQSVLNECTRLGWPLPRLVLEPGRLLAARAGVAVYELGTQKEAPGGLQIAAVDGGMADNPRVAMYAARYTALVVDNPAGDTNQRFQVVGRFCESGDVLIPEINLPAVSRGDLLAVPAAGAYQLSMSSNYNLASRPTVLWLEPGDVKVMQIREAAEDNLWWRG